MGNVSSVRGGGDGGLSGEEEAVEFQEPMGQSPPPSPGGSVPMVPLPRYDEIQPPNQEPMHWSTEQEDMLSGQAIPTIISWSSGGYEVAVEGLGTIGRLAAINCREPLQRSDKDFTIMKVLPSGVYHYKFIVDGERRCSPEVPWVRDEMGNECNVLDLLEAVPEHIENVATFEPPLSPESSYNSWPLGSEDFSKDPPAVPPHLLMTLLNSPSFVDSSSSSRPQRVVLNHLYIQKGKGDQPLVALGVTHRFLSKYVTVVLYKPLGP
ncbi:unnamed protein product [Spirodela intermedia]|uniref:Association with the SNF1 complex (ASC) domain-containing protein n=1 Tax=Spirodela intermedia TaxID=51605 RepID=A0A7I8I7Z7_SPIIN|nr:unnamed protein product [Spirodela intermedia]CAA6653598.1 unnamed protein product [Spirodela intermedia]